MTDDFMQSSAAPVWAKAFIERVKADPSIATDEGAMIGWFANAIMRGYDERAWTHPGKAFYIIEKTNDDGYSWWSAERGGTWTTDVAEASRFFDRESAERLKIMVQREWFLDWGLRVTEHGWAENDDRERINFLEDYLFQFRDGEESFYQPPMGFLTGWAPNLRRMVDDLMSNTDKRQSWT